MMMMMIRIILVRIMMMVMVIENDDGDDLEASNPINNDPLKVAAISAQECLSPALHHGHGDLLDDGP